MKKIIRDKDLVLYVNDQLSSHEKKEIEEQAIQNQETDMLLNCVIANYSCQKDYADELLGIDDFDLNSEYNIQGKEQFVMPMAADKKNEE